MSEREVYERETRDFLLAYNSQAKQVVQLESTDNAAAADKHVTLSTIVAKYLHAQERFIDPADKLFLRNEIVSRCMQALVLRSMQLSGFADLAMSLSSTRSIQADIERARRRLENARRDDTDDDDDDEEEDEDVDPRVHTNGLYEYISHERIDVALGNLPGYEEQHRMLVNAYFLINGTPEDTRLTDDTAERRPKTRAGANVILYGPPGTGKTAAAKAVAKSLGLNLAFVNAENLLSAYRSETEKNLRALYEKMRAIVRVSGRNVVLLLDEVDGLVKNRSSGAAVTSGEYSLLTRFLTILEPNDGKDNYGVFSVFTTNRLSNLDDAFRRRCTTVFMGYVKKRESTVRLFHAFLHQAIDSSTRGAKSDEYDAEIRKNCRYWVPGDFARFKRSMIDPYQLEMYFRRTNTTYDEFIAARIGEVDNGDDSVNTPNNGSREITVNLPLLSYKDILSHAARYQPITPPVKYNEYEPPNGVMDQED